MTTKHQKVVYDLSQVDPETLVQELRTRQQFVMDKLVLQRDQLRAEIKKVTDLIRAQRRLMNSYSTVSKLYTKKSDKKKTRTSRTPLREAVYNVVSKSEHSLKPGEIFNQLYKDKQKSKYAHKTFYAMVYSTLHRNPHIFKKKEDGTFELTASTPQ